MRNLSLVLTVIVCAAMSQGQQVSPSDDQNVSSRAKTIDSGIVGCISSVKRTFPTKNQHLPAAIRPQVPPAAYVRMVLPLSNTDTLTIYELGNWGRLWERFNAGRDGGELTDPDTRLLVTRQGDQVFRYAMKDMQTPEGHHEDWGISAVAMSAAHQCSDHLDITYLVVQSGNSGGFFFALQRLGDGYKLIPISDANQGRLVLSAKNARDVEVWTALDAGVCGACAKPFIVKELVFDGAQFRLTSKQKTRKQYGSFQDEPIVIRP
jgi:hypothetical protein